MSTNGWPSEAGNWYYPDGRPCQSIIGKNGKERPPNLRDARPLNLKPGTTKIIKCAASVGLERWKAEQLLLAGLTLPRTEGEAEADWIKRVWEDSQAQAIAAAERGTQIHAAIEGYYRGEPFVPAEWHNWVQATAQTIRFTYGEPQWNAEKSFATDSYGGKIDLNAPGLILDIKTKDGSLADVKLYDEHYMQLAAYAKGLMPRAVLVAKGHVDHEVADALAMPGRIQLVRDVCSVREVPAPWPRAGIVFVSRTEPKAIVCEVAPPELERGWAMFSALLAYWRAQNRMEVV